MNVKVLFAVAALVAVPSFASAEEVIVRERAPEVTVDRPAVTIEKREPAVRVEERATSGASEDCRRTTVHKEDASGSTTIRKKECD
jgi:hypothetical protein